MPKRYRGIHVRHHTGEAGMTHTTEQERAEFEKAWRERPIYMGGVHQKEVAYIWWMQAARRAPAVPVPSRRPTLEEIEEAVGYHSSGWDCVDPSELIDAIMNIATAPKPPDDLKRGNPATKPDEGPSSCAHCGNPWGEAAPVQLPENLREGEPYDNPAFEALARALGVWGTAQSAVCAQFWIAAKEQST